MNMMASEITCVPIVSSTVCSGADQRKHQSSMSLVFVRGTTGDQWIPLTKGPAMQKMFPFDYIIMNTTNIQQLTTVDIYHYPMLRADSRFWLVNNREIWSRISRLTSSAWDIKTKERHWWRHNGDSDRRPLSLPLRYDLVTLCLYGDLGQINVIAEILKLRKRFRMSQILFEHGINSLPLVCFRGYGNLSTLSIAIPRLAFGRAWYCDAACG